MLAMNMISQPIQVVSKKGTQLVSVLTTNYKVFNSFVLPKEILLKNGVNPTESRIAFNAYDTKGNLLEQQKIKDVVKSYVYDYNLSYPIAEVTNATTNAIAYTSFESDGNGNWNISAPSPDARKWTGKRSYVLTGKTISKSSLPSNVYVVSLWAIGGTSITINSQSVSPTITRNGWSYYEYTTSTTTSVSVTGTGTIDELRLYPKTAEMITSSYDPLVGITSQTSQNNRTIYYEYDTHNRLHVIRDDEGNILNRYQYNYQVR
jgi:hypothetical protein